MSNSVLKWPSATAANPSGEAGQLAGALIASWIFPQLGIHLGSGIVSEILEAAIGAVLLLSIIRLVRARSRGEEAGTAHGANVGVRLQAVEMARRV
jgi:Transglycosylase associated protein